MELNKDFLQEFITKYEIFYTKNFIEIEERESKNSALLKEFLNRYNLYKIKDLSIDEYCFEKGNRNTFCYWLDNTLNDMCNIHIDKTGGFQKFHLQKINGIYKFKKKNQKNCWAGNDKDTVFKNVLNEIIELIKEAITGQNVDKIEKNKIYQPTKAKITFLYNPERWIPISVNNDVDSFLAKAFINFQNFNEGFMKKRELIYEFYKEVKKSVPTITTWRMMIFIYDENGYRYLLNKQKKVSNTIVKSKQQKSRYSPISKVKENDIKCILDFDPVIVEQNYFENDEIISDQEIEKAERIKKTIGKEGEKIVFMYLKKRAKDKFKGLLTPCFENKHNLHHDFSYVENSNRYFIEVKASSKRISEGMFFYMSKFEYQFMMKHKNFYYLYYVADVFNSPEIYVLSPESFESKLSTNTFELLSNQKLVGNY